MKEQNKILVVDDSTVIIQLMDDILTEAGYSVDFCMSGEEAVELLDTQEFDLILLDVVMPGIDGFETCKKILSKTPDALIIFVTGLNNDDSIKKAFDVGGVDYITKPLKEIEVISRVKTHIELGQHRKGLHEENINLEEHIREKTHDFFDAQKTTILTLATLAELRDNETGAHIIRTQNYVKVLTDYLLQEGIYEDLTEDDAENMIFAAPLHDIGKIGIRDAILLKPAQLTADEFEIMKTHTTLGKEAFEKSKGSIGSSSFFECAQDIVYSHHEKWDGSGYPQSLSGEAIPLSGRIMAVADVYDALISKRCYKKPFSHEISKDIIIESSGSHFDPKIVEAFIATEKMFKEIAYENADSQEERDSL